MAYIDTFKTYETLIESGMSPEDAGLQVKTLYNPLNKVLGDLVTNEQIKEDINFLDISLDSKIKNLESVLKVSMRSEFLSLFNEMGIIEMKVKFNFMVKALSVIAVGVVGNIITTLWPRFFS